MILDTEGKDPSQHTTGEEMKHVFKIKLEDNIPLSAPQSRGARPSVLRQSMHDMKVGQSFVAQIKARGTIQAAATKLKPQKYTIRQVTVHMVRCWRLE